MWLLQGIIKIICELHTLQLFSKGGKCPTGWLLCLIQSYYSGGVGWQFVLLSVAAIASYGFGCPLQQSGAAISEVCLVWSPNLCRRLANSSKRTHKSARPNCALLPAIPFSLRAPKNMNQISKLVLADLGAVPSVTGGYLAVFVYDFGCPLWQNSALIGVCYIIAVSRAGFVCVH